MSSRLDDVFSNILRSERQTEERKRQFNEIRRDVSMMTENIRRHTEEVQSLSGQLAIKLQRADAIKTDENAQTARNAALVDSKYFIQEDIENMQMIMDKEESVFIRGEKKHNLEAFMFMKQMELELKRDEREAEEIEKNIRSDLIAFEKSLAAIETLINDVNDMEERYQTQIRELEDLDMGVEIEEISLQELREEHEEQTEFILVDPEHRSHFEELEALHNSEPSSKRAKLDNNEQSENHDNTIE